MTTTSKYDKDVVVLDFETDAIANRPAYPPAPVGVSIWYPDQTAAPSYFAWGHPRGNNCSAAEGEKQVRLAVRSGRYMLCHNAKFDLAVMLEKMGVPLPPWEKIHDTLFLLFLNDPHALSLSLKPAAAALLKMPPDEQEAVRDWLIDNRIVKRTDKGWGAHIAKAPGDLVGRYANGDTLRTYELFKYLMPRIVKAGMGEAYDRERKLLLPLMEAERRGIRVDQPALEEAASTCSFALEDLDSDIRRVIRVEDDFSFNKREQLAQLLTARKLVTPLPRTPTGKFKTSGDEFLEHIIDPELRRLFAYRGPLNTCVNTFLMPWLGMAAANNGRLHPSWNQVRGEDYGARSGRLSSSNPNFMNVPNEFNVEVPHGFPQLPNLREFVLPEEGHVWVKADYNSQEIRMLAHFAGGKLQEMYTANPRTDVHNATAELIKERTGMEVDRKATKIVAFSLLYGGGVGLIASRLGIAVEKAAELKGAYMRSLVGVAELQRDVAAAAKKDGVVSWGGRMLTAPFAKGGHESGERRLYALLNYLIQGSSADFTKQSLVDYFDDPGNTVFQATVHDENDISVPEDDLKNGIRRLRRCMQEQELSVPMIAEFSIGSTWANQIKVNI